MEPPRTADEIFENFEMRKRGLLRALTEETEELYRRCDPEKDNLCLYGEPDGSWMVDLPAEEVPPELPEPCLGINFARDGMQRSDWLALLAVHSDAWLMAVAFYYGAKLDAKSRLDVFRAINQSPTLYEIVTGRSKPKSVGPPASKRRRPEGVSRGGEAQAADAPLPTGRLLSHNDIQPTLKGRSAELFWPADNKWYLVEIHSVNPRSRSAKVQYTSGEFEDLNLEETIREGHMSLITM